MESKKEQITCSQCDRGVDEDNDFCPFCGSIFVDNVSCVNHNELNASGVCVICCEPYCEKCGTNVNDIFLCEKHSEYEIYQGMARVFGISDEAQAQYVKSCFEQEGLHPFIYSRKAGAWHMGSGDYTLFRASGEYDGHIVNEIKVMVPLQEVLKAESILLELDVSS
ncbi:hypothetical protein B6I21_09025 [candidate division KSB1 bacterium 4572_119]|nr:MAG: hypothetical protein B6I21_09025 [candidate division KSB1 bacterium 4572_119]